MVVSAFRRAAGQRLHGMAQAAGDRLEALSRPAFAAREGDDERTVFHHSHRAREEGARRVFERFDAHHLAESGDGLVRDGEQRLGRVVARREAGPSRREDEVYSLPRPLADGLAYLFFVVWDYLPLFRDAALREGEPLKLGPRRIDALALAALVADGEHRRPDRAPYFRALGDAEESMK